MRPVLPTGAARSGGEGQHDAARASVDGQRCRAHAFGKNYNSVAEALGPHVATSSRTVVLQFNRAVVDLYGCLVKPATTSTSLASLSQERRCLAYSLASFATNSPIEVVFVKCCVRALR